MADRRLLLAGSFGPERLPARPDPDDADWFMPLHIRDERAARDRIGTQVAAGADIVVAPTWLTHRRALLPLGETRQAATWTAAAVRLARDAVELGLERREGALADAPDSDVRRGRPRPLVAAALPALDDEPEGGSGRLLPRKAATERDYRDGAGLLADAEPDLLLVEGQRGEAEARMAMAEATSTGLPTWAALHPDAAAAADVEAWLEWGRYCGLERILLPSLADAAAAADGDLPWGGQVRSADAIPAWLDAGAGVVACLDGATAAALGPLRDALDGAERADLETARQAQGRWRDHVARAAAIAPGGAAAWLGSPPMVALPDGFEWLIVDAAEARHLPAGHYRLVVNTAREAEAGRLLERGGILACEHIGVPRGGEAALRRLVLDDRADPPLAIYRRER